MKELRQVTVLGLGLLGSSITLVVSKGLSGVKAVGYSHRRSTRQKARKLDIADEVFDDIGESVADADIVILATPICTFEQIFAEIAPFLKAGCIVTDVGSTKVLAHRWARKGLGSGVCYIGSHPIAGSEQRGVEFARDDLFYGAKCILTTGRTVNAAALKMLQKFWAELGCSVSVMTATKHDKILAAVSHLPHATAAGLINASDDDELQFAGKGFIDTSRVASGPANVWADIFYTNSGNVCRGIDKTISQLNKLRDAIKAEDKNKIEKLLETARSKRAKLIKYKMKNKEIM
ncbi:MAG: prephenate dehydrogenase [Anaerohalosphaeraceae bacterium]|nr:prephenate dehydrogenase [Anaerohalosphaeraceae bacterium]